MRTWSNVREGTMEEFSVSVRPDAQGRQVVSPSGDIDLATHQQLKVAIHDLLSAGHVDIVVDLSDTRFLDSTALGALISARRRAYALKGSFSIVCSNERLLQVFRATSLDRVFTIRPV